MNMSGVPKRPEIPIKDFAAAIGVEPAIILPFEPELFGTAANNGQMISETDPYIQVITGGRPYRFAADGRSHAWFRQKSIFKKLLGK
jgi:pilus assembly protein CpaE